MEHSESRVVSFDTENHQYVIEIDGVLAAYTVDHLRGGRHFFVHTETISGFEGRGVARALVKAALDDVRSQGQKIVPLCPYVAGFVAKNSDYDEIVDHQMLDRIEGRLHHDESG